jgi:HSP20 family protein
MFAEQNYNNKNYDCNSSETQIDNLVAPLTDIYVSKEGYQIFLDMPGVAKENFNLKVDEDELIVTGKKENSSKPQKFLNNEIFYSGFHRHFILPNDIDKNKIDASYQDGVLKLFLHKKEEAKPKVIEIK